MGIIVGILSALCAILIFIVFIFWQCIGNILEEDMKDNPKKYVSLYLEHEAEEEYPCTLLLSVQEGAAFDGSVFDFSKYEENGIIGLTQCSRAISSKTLKHNDNDDEEPLAAFLPNQKVLKMKDGSYEWDFRSLM